MKKIYFEFYTGSKVTNRGSKLCVKLFSAKLLSAFENEKITVYITWPLQILSSSNVHLEELFEPEVK